MGRLLAAVLTIASAVCLYFALTQPIVISKLASLNQIIRVIYPEENFVAAQAARPAQSAPAAAAPAAPAAADPAAPAEPAPLSPYELRVTQYEKMFTALVLNTDSAKKTFAELTQAKGYTAWQSARVLYDAGDTLSATAIIAFSIVYPIVKTLALMVIIALNVRQKTALKLAEWTHKYTMLDVFVAAVTVVAVSTQQLLVIDTGPAIWWYVGYLVAGFAAVMVLVRAGQEKAPAASA
ncbi:MAG: paraquat-inducible protein A [Hyphomonadaceae bacterium]|nr:paraquat-inducible protein A [Hyphomonadaceae bacterium]